MLLREVRFDRVKDWFQTANKGREGGLLSVLEPSNAR